MAQLRTRLKGSHQRAPPPAPLLGTKLHAPRIRFETVVRWRLMHALQASRKALVLLVAPPGFGKTTLVSHWQELDERRFAWLSLDAGDDDPVVFWRYVVEAVRRVAPGFGTEAEAALRRRPKDVVDAVVPRILNELDSLSAEIVLVLDDFHSIGSACHDSISLFLERQPSRVELVVCSRSDPTLPLGRLRASGGLLELRAAELSFTDAEADTFLNGTLRLGLSRAGVSALRKRTEGWPAGLYLASLSLREAPDREELVHEFGGSSRHVADYLTEVVLDGLDPDLRAFLLETSLLERMCGPLCDAVTGRTGSSGLLVDLEEANLFLVPLDARREWYRHHHLFAELLRDELERRQPDRASELRLRASGWHAAAGQVDEAIGYALAAGEVEGATQLVGEHYRTTLEWGGVERVLGWLETFPLGVVARDARLSIPEAWVMSFLNRREDATRAIEAVRESGYEGPLPDGARSVEGGAALLRAGFSWGNVHEMLGAARRAFELEGGQESAWRATAHVELGLALYLSGRLEEARPVLEGAAALARRADHWLDAFGARFLLAGIALQADDLDQAERWARDGLELAESHGLSEIAAGGYAYTTLGAVLARRGHLEEADRLLSRGLLQLQPAPEPLLLAEALLFLVPVRRALGRPGEARALLGEARGLVESCADPGTLHARVEEVTEALTPAHRRVDGGSDLTERELEVLRLLAKGLHKREIGRTLFLSYNTIHSHTKSIYRKLRVSSRTEALDRARRHGLL